MFHHREGVNTSLFTLDEGPLHDFFSQFRESYNRDPFEVRFGGAIKALPFGRGENLPPEELHKDQQCELPIVWERITSMRQLVIESSGNAYLCPWSRSPSIGSAFEESVYALLQRALEGPSITATMIRSGPITAAKEAGFPIPDGVEERSWSCRACNKIFKGARIKGLIK